MRMRTHELKSSDDFMTKLQVLEEESETENFLIHNNFLENFAQV